MRSLALGLALAAIVAPAAAQSPSRDWHPDDRTVIGDFAHISAVAAAPDRVYIVSPASLLIWRPQFREWEGPFDPPPAVPLSRAFAALIDPLDHSLWLAHPGGWIHYQPDIHLWEHGSVGGGVRGIAFNADAPTEGLYVATASGWLNLPRGAAIATPARPPARPLAPTTVADALRDEPSLHANSAAVLLDQRLRTAQYTSAARAFDGSGWYLGTWGLGLLFLAEGAILPERVPYGLPGDLVGAVFDAPGGVWVATDRTADADAALTFVSSDLEDFETLAGVGTFGLPFDRVRDLTGQGQSLWAATDGGVARVDLETGDVRLFDESRGLPDRRVFSIVSRRGRITAGTARGLARILDSVTVEPLVPSFADPVPAVSVSNDSTWVGTRVGLYVLPPGADELVRPTGIGASPRFRDAVLRIEWAADTLVALTPHALLSRDPGTGAWSLGPDLSPLLGQLRTMVAGDRGVWVAGDEGVGFAPTRAAALRVLGLNDLPGRVTDLAVDDDYLWVGTDRGLVRFRLSAIRP